MAYHTGGQREIERTGSVKLIKNIMAKDNNSSVEEKKKKSRTSKFQLLGKYFLIVLVVAGQAYLAYTVIDNNYDSIYGYLQSLNSSETGKYELEEIIVNPANTNGKRYLLVELSLELVEKEDVQLVEENKSKIRNNLIKYLSARSVPELQGIKGKEDLRIELVNIINDAMGARSVRNLYYSKYVMQ